MFLLIDKPGGMTSHGVVDVVRKITGEKRVGHGGTLDPLATGILIVGVGRESTKKLGGVSLGKDKTYRATIVLGEEKDTDDAEGKTISVDPKKIKEMDLNKVLSKFRGEIVQTPPNFSAVKIEGKKAYEISRSGGRPKIEPRKVTIHLIKLLSFSYPEFEIECRVTSGTYIRSLARDIGKSLGTFGYIKKLRRTAVGEIEIKDCVLLEKLTPENWNSLARHDL